VANGVPTLAGWIEYIYATGWTGLLGLAGGLSFWTAMRLSGQIAGKSNGPEAQSRYGRAASWSVASAGVLLACTIILLPTMVRDSSCHNLFRDGRASIGPQIYGNIGLRQEDWPALKQTFVDFGETHSLSFRSDEQVQRGKINWRDLNLCNDAGIVIKALDRPWLARMPRLAQIDPSFANQGISFSVYELKPGSDWEPLARELLNRIDRAWPQKTTFRGPDGRLISVEQALRGRP
jgi:hypothetical protein